MDHVARFAIHQEANVRTCWRFCIGFLWKRCCLHISLFKFHLLVLKYQFNTCKAPGVNETLNLRGDDVTLACPSVLSREARVHAGLVPCELSQTLSRNRSASAKTSVSMFVHRIRLAGLQIGPFV
jgi:hypothetical protein